MDLAPSGVLRVKIYFGDLINISLRFFRPIFSRQKFVAMRNGSGREFSGSFRYSMLNIIGTAASLYYVAHLNSHKIYDCVFLHTPSLPALRSVGGKIGESFNN